MKKALEIVVVAVVVVAMLTAIRWAKQSTYITASAVVTEVVGDEVLVTCNGNYKEGTQYSFFIDEVDHLEKGDHVQIIIDPADKAAAYDDIIIDYVYID